MKKFLALILVLAMVIFCFAACSDTADSEQEDADSTTSEAATSEITESENQKEEEQENGEDEAGEESTGPTNRAEAVGIYSFGTTNSYGTGVQYALWLNGDGTAYVFYNSSFSGLSKYIAEEWAFNEDGTASVGALTSEDGDPQGNMFDADNGYTSTWVLNADGTCVPQDWTGVVKIVGEGTDVGDDELPEEAYPTGAEAVGIYTFGTTNSYGTGVQYALWLNGDGTAYIFYNSSFSGLSKYTAEEWTLNEDGSISVGALTAEDGEPQGDMFDADNGYTSTWILNDDGSCVPQDWTGVVKTVGEGTDVGDGELPEEAYPLTNPGEGE